MNEVGLSDQKYYLCNKTVIDGHTTTYISSYVNIGHAIYKARSRMSTARRFYPTQKFFPSTFE